MPKSVCNVPCHAKLVMCNALCPVQDEDLAELDAELHMRPRHPEQCAAKPVTPVHLISAAWHRVAPVEPFPDDLV